MLRKNTTNGIITIKSAGNVVNLNINGVTGAELKEITIPEPYRPKEIKCFPSICASGERYFCGYMIIDITGVIRTYWFSPNDIFNQNDGLLNWSDVSWIV